MSRLDKLNSSSMGLKVEGHLDLQSVISIQIQIGDDADVFRLQFFTGILNTLVL